MTYLGDIKKGQSINGRFISASKPILTEIWIVRSDDVFKPSSDGISLQKDSLKVPDLYQIKIDTFIDVNSGGFWRTERDYDVILAPEGVFEKVLFTFSCENRYVRGTDNANTINPDPAGTIPSVEEIREEFDQNSKKLDVKISTRSGKGEYDKVLDDKISSRSPAGEYDDELDCKLSSRSPSNEYDTQLDARLSEMSGKGEYHSQLKSNFESLTELAGELLDSLNKVTNKLPQDKIFGTEHLDTITEIHDYIKEMLTEWCPAVAMNIDKAYHSGVILYGHQPNYEPAKAGDKMDWVSSPNMEAIKKMKDEFNKQWLHDFQGDLPVSPTVIEGLSALYAMARNEIRESPREKVWCNNLGEPMIIKKKSKTRSHEVQGKCERCL